MNKNEDVAGAYVWIPGQGIDASASRRLRERYPRPTQPMGKAWFIGETRKMYPEMLDCEAPQLENVNQYLFEILSGVKCFGTLDFEPRYVWESWFLYFLAQCTTPQNFDSDSTLISGLMICCPDVDKMREREPQFLADVLATSGRVLLEPQFWTNGEININHDI